MKVALTFSEDSARIVAGLEAGSVFNAGFGVVSEVGGGGNTPAGTTDLTDRATGIKYVLYVENGALKMEVAE